jgi:hypothetical protein
MDTETPALIYNSLSDLRVNVKCNLNDLASAYFSEGHSDDVGHDSFKSADPGHFEATRPP